MLRLSVSVAASMALLCVLMLTWKSHMQTVSAHGWLVSPTPRDMSVIPFNYVPSRDNKTQFCGSSQRQATKAAAKTVLYTGLEPNIVVAHNPAPVNFSLIQYTVNMTATGANWTTPVFNNKPVQTPLKAETDVNYSNNQKYAIKLTLPFGMECEYCVLRWFYDVSNQTQASYVNCADVKVVNRAADTIFRIPVWNLDPPLSVDSVRDRLYNSDYLKKKGIETIQMPDNTLSSNVLRVADLITYSSDFSRYYITVMISPTVNATSAYLAAVVETAPLADILAVPIAPAANDGSGGGSSAGGSAAGLTGAAHTLSMQSVTLLGITLHDGIATNRSFYFLSSC